MFETLNPTISAAAQKILAGRLRNNEAYLKRLQKTTGLPSEIAADLLQDINDLLQNGYCGLRLTYEEINKLLDCLVKTGDNLDGGTQDALYIFNEYTAVYKIHEAEEKGETYTVPDKVLQTVAQYECLRRKPGKTPQDAEEAAVITRYIYTVLSVYGTAPINLADIMEIKPAGICGGVMDKALYSLNHGLLLDMLKQVRKNRRARTARDNKTTAERNATEENQNTTINLRQNVANMLLDTQAADKDESEDRARDLLLLLREREKQQRQWEEETETLKKQAAEADEVERPRLEQALTARLKEHKNTAVSIQDAKQAIKGLMYIVSTQAPEADGATGADYVTTAAELTRYCTGTTRPNNEQKQRVLRALNMWSTTQVTFLEYLITYKRGKRKDTAQDGTEIEVEDGGKRKTYTLHRTTTNFVTVKYSESLAEVGGNISDSMQITLHIDHIITQGRQMERIKLNSGEYAYIEAPQSHLLTGEQFASFNTAPEINALAIITGKPHKEENALLDEMFEYTKQINAQQGEVDRCRKAEEVAEARAKATGKPLHLQEHQRATAEREAAETELKRIKNHIRNHKRPDDLNTWKRCLQKAKETGLIVRYWSHPRKGKDGTAVTVWQWERPQGKKKKAKKQTAPEAKAEKI